MGVPVAQNTLADLSKRPTPSLLREVTGFKNIVLNATFDSSENANPICMHDVR